MMKPIGRLTTQQPAAQSIQWKLQTKALDAFVLEVLGTLGKDGAAVWYPITAYTLRLIQAARWRLWHQGGAAIRVRSDLDSNRFYVRADFSTARAFSAWNKEATRRGQTANIIR